MDILNASKECLVNNIVQVLQVLRFTVSTLMCLRGNVTHVDKLLDFWLPQIAADLCSQQQTRRNHQLPVLLVEASLQHQLLKVNKSHRRGDRLQTDLLAHSSHLPLQAGGEEWRDRGYGSVF